MKAQLTELDPLVSPPAAALAPENELLLVPETADRLEPLPQPRRLVVLVPDREFDEVRLGAVIHRLALHNQAQIHFIALASDPDMDSFLRRRLATLTSLVSDRLISTSARVSYTAAWEQAILEVWQEDDLVVCLEGQHVRGLLFGRRPLGLHLASTLSIPVLVLRGFRLGGEIAPRGGLRELLFWAAALLVIVAFAGLQVFLGRLFAGPAATVMLSLSIPVELFVLSKLTFRW
jgi:hypothetical protein